MDLKDKTLFITGASRGIGKAIALRAAADGANIAVAAKTAEPHPRLPGTIYTSAEEIEGAGGRALPLQVDVRDEEAVRSALRKTAEHFGGIDILVNNASAIMLAPSTKLPMKRYDLMQDVNTRATYMCSALAHEYLARGDNAHILVLSPPLNLDPKWFAQNTAYTISKYGMSMCVLGLSAEYARDGIAVNALWPRTTIATAAVRNLLGGEEMVRRSRKPEMMGDAAHAVLTRPAGECTGNFFIDETVLREQGVEDFEPYAVEPGAELQVDLFVDGA